MEYVFVSKLKTKVAADPAQMISLLCKSKALMSILMSTVKDFNKDDIKKIKIDDNSVYFIDKHKNEWEVSQLHPLERLFGGYNISYRKRGIHKTNTFYTVQQFMPHKRPKLPDSY
jgi:hypothetical protein